MPFGSLLGRSWRVLSPLDRLLGSLEVLLEPPGALFKASCLPFPLPPALDHSARRMLQTPFSTPYRTSTSLNLTPLNSTQLTSLFDLLGLHFGASWPPQIDPRSAQDRSKSPLEALFFKNVNFHEISAGVVFGAFPGFPRRPKIDPRRLQDDLQDILFSTSFLSSISVRLEFDFGSIWAPSWPPFGSQNRPKCRALAGLVEPKTTLTTHDGPRRPQEPPKSLPRAI